MKLRLAKRVIGIIVIVFIVITTYVTCFAIRAISDGVLKYEVSDNYVTVVGYTNSATGALEIPSEIYGEPITSIGQCAFSNCTGLTSITIPDSVTSIGQCAFSGCTGLENITVEAGNPIYHSAGNCLIATEDKILITGCKNSIIPTDGSVKNIGNRAFSDHTELTSITIHESVTSIGEYAFYGCTGLTSITIPSSVTSISSSAFSGCTGLENITVESGNPKYHSAGNCMIATEGKALITGCKNSIIPTDGSVKYIGDYAFSGCTGLTNMTIPDSVTSIGQGAFYGCTGLTSITIPDSVTSIGQRAFSDCTGLTSITIPDSVTSIGRGAFSGCTGLTSITILSGVTSIGEYAFSDCTGLTSIMIPGSVTGIGEYAFSGCTGLTSITIPDSVTSIARDTFSGCTGLASITIPNGVTSIGKSAFYNCTRLTSIIIPKSVTSINLGAFVRCSYLIDVYYLGSENEWREITIAKSNEPIIDAKKHYPIETSSVEPTCTETGFSEYVYWSDTDPIEYIVEPVVYPALGHNYTEEYYPSACTTDGYSIYTCTRCNDSYTETYEATGHDYTEEYYPSTCTTDGYCIYTCTHCNDTYTETYEATGHDYTEEYYPSTCTTDGYCIYTCTHCNDTYTETYEATGHDYYVKEYKEPTCTQGGYNVYCCYNCGHTQKEILYANGHDPILIRNEPTCTKAGTQFYTCAACGDMISDMEIIPALGHKPITDYATEPTCTEYGYTEGSHCTVCNQIIKQQYRINPTGHNFVTKSTENNNGNTIYYRTYCSKCGEIKSELETIQGSKTITLAQLIQRIIDILFGRFKNTRIKYH